MPNSFVCVSTLKMFRLKSPAFPLFAQLLVQVQIKENITKLRVSGLSVRNSPVTGEFPAQKASNAEEVSIWWRHHGRWLTSFLLDDD